MASGALMQVSVFDASGVGDGDGGRSGHFDEQRHLFRDAFDQVHHLLQSTERLALPGRQNCT